MIYAGIIEGIYVDLRSCTENDAEFTLAIRQDTKYSMFIPRIDGTVEQQKDWISKQRGKPGDYFFVMWSKDGQRIGTISIYNISGTHAEAGRLASYGNALQSIEAQMLAFDFAFNNLGLETIVSFIYADNKRALRFSRQFGGTFDPPKVFKDGDRPMCMKTNTRESFSEARPKLEKMIYRSAKGSTAL